VGTRTQIREQITRGGASSSSGAEIEPGRTGTNSRATNDQQTSGDAMANSTIATIPESYGLPAVVVSLVREQGDWKINVPDTLTPERLQDNLTRHLMMANQQRDQWPADAKETQQAIAHHVLLAIMDVNDAGGAAGRVGGGAGGVGNRR
jgi:hypothetical protein